MLANRKRYLHSETNSEKMRYEKEPFPHYVKYSQKEIHGWYHPKEPFGRRDCTSERLLLNPYNGCMHNCIFCYAKAYWDDPERLIVYENFDKVVAKQLDKLAVASCGYLSPVTDPFQSLEEYYGLSEKIIRVFVERNIPIEFITKASVKYEILEILKKQEHSFGQISILTLDEELRKKLVPNGASTEELFKNFQKLKSLNIFAVARIDPVIPYITDDFQSLEELIHEVVRNGASHIIVSSLDIPTKLYNEVVENLSKINPDIYDKYKFLFTEKIGSYLHAKKDYRHRLFSVLSGICKKLGVTFALCMEFVKVVEKGRFRLMGMNRFYMTSLNCEGFDVPIYIRDGKIFKPVKGCRGNCLTCVNVVCEIPELSTAGAWKLKDYLRFSKKITTSSQLSFL